VTLLAIIAALTALMLVVAGIIESWATWANALVFAAGVVFTVVAQVGWHLLARYFDRHTCPACKGDVRDCKGAHL